MQDALQLTWIARHGRWQLQVSADALKAGHYDSCQRDMRVGSRVERLQARSLPLARRCSRCFGRVLWRHCGGTVTTACAHLELAIPAALVSRRAD